MSDVGRAWRLTETAHEDVAFPIAVGLQCRYALITASINSLASNLLPRFLAALVEKRVWPITQGLAYARHVPDQLHRAEALAKLVLVPRVSWPERLEETIQEILAILKSMMGGQGLVNLLSQLAPRLSGRLVNEALDMARSIKDEGLRIEALTQLTQLIPTLSKSSRQQTLRDTFITARAAWKEGDRSRALARLAPILPEPWLRQALETARAIH